MKILWWSNHPTAPTGYGTQTATWCRRLRDAGHQVIISANWAGEPRAHEWENIPVLPPGEDRFAQDSLARDIDAIDPDLVWTLYDAWAIKPAPLRDRLVAMWAPVDHNPVPPKVKHSIVESGAVPVAYSKFGYESFVANGLEALYVPHGIDTTVYQPHDQREARDRLGYPQDAFLVGMVAANKSGGYLRKGWDVAFEAFAALAHFHPDAHMYVHSKPVSQMGIDLQVCARNYDVPADKVTFLPAAMHEYGISDEKMSWVYSAFDVLLSPSLGEGFGLPTLEAQACGVPVVVTDATAQTELCGAGWLAKAHRLYDAEQAADWYRPYILEVVRCLAEAYDARGDTAVRAQARRFAENYAIETVWAEHFEPTLAELEGRFSTAPILL